MMPELISSSTRRAILGLGTTGRSVARFWKARGIPFVALDTRAELANDLDLRRELIGIEAHFGEFDDAVFDTMDLLIASPGIAMDSPVLVKAQQAGVEIRSDIDVFVAETDKPVIGITGSNGKTTTTMLTHHILKSADLNLGIGGNIGDSFAKQVAQNNYEQFVLELSSFQLDGVYDFAPHIAIITNITPDHLDRYDYDFETSVMWGHQFLGQGFFEVPSRGWGPA